MAEGKSSGMKAGFAGLDFLPSGSKSGLSGLWTP
jgi:hypothetical protein